jgi:outer membrane protein assembly factor BamB
MKPLALALLLASAGVAQTTATAIPRSDWPEFHRGAEHRGDNRTETALSVTTVPGMQLLWQGANGGGIRASPVVAGAMVYVASDISGALYAFDAAQGKPVWSVPNTPARFSTTPAVSNRILYVGGLDTYLNEAALYALDAKTGKQLWETVLGVNEGAGMVSSPVVVDGVVYVGSPAGYVNALDATTGAIIWQSPIWGDGYAAPAVNNGIVYYGAGGFGAQVYAFDASTGQQIWIADTGYEIYAAPALAYELVYVASTDGHLYAFNAATGRLIWKAFYNSASYSSPAVANGFVYVGSYDNNLYALNALNGKLVWHQTTGAPISSSPAVANGVVYVGSADTNLYAFAAATGQLLWSGSTGQPLLSSPAVSNGMVYVAAGDGALHAYGLPPRCRSSEIVF